jgi:hypothetical protein
MSNAEHSKFHSKTLIGYIGGLTVLLAISIWGLATYDANDKTDMFNASGASSVSVAKSASSGISAAGSGSSGSQDGSGSPGSSSGSGSSAGSGSLAGSGSSAGTGSPGSSAGSSSQDGSGDVAQAINITLSIDCSIAPSGSLLFTKNISLSSQATVLQALRESDVLVSSQNLGMGAYVTTIAGFGEGLVPGHPQSGWKYYVNGVAPGLSCDKYILNDGDDVLWLYVEQA